MTKYKIMKRILLLIILCGGCDVKVTTDEEFNKLKEENRGLSLQVYSLKLDTMSNGVNNRFRDRLEFISDSMLEERFKTLK